jgi:hypothetical protein
VEYIGVVINKSILHKIYDQEMDRKHFLQYSGAVLLGVIGVSAIVPLLLKSNPAAKQVTLEPVQTPRRGFGNAKYGK